MGFWELLALVSAMATILGVFLTLYAFINNRTLKEEARLTRELINRMEENMNKGTQESKKLLEKITELIVADGQKTRQAISGLKGTA